MKRIEVLLGVALGVAAFLLVSIVGAATSVERRVDDINRLQAEVLHQAAEIDALRARLDGLDEMRLHITVEGAPVLGVTEQ